MSTYVGQLGVELLEGDRVRVELLKDDRVRVQMMKDYRLRVDHVQANKPRFGNFKVELTRVFNSVEMLPTSMQEAMALLFVMNSEEECGVCTIDGVGSIYVDGGVGMNVYWLDIPIAGGELR